MERNETTIICYMPVYHAGFAKFFETYPEVKDLVLLSSDLLLDLGPVQKDIHALSPMVLKTMLESLDRFEEVQIADENLLKSFNQSTSQVILPDEGVMHSVADKYFPLANVEWGNVFLRWDNKKAKQENEIRPDQEISEAEFDKQMMSEAVGESAKSSDWWRQVGAILLDKDGQIVLQAHNQHLPSDHTPYIDGDVRAQFHKGEEIELTTAIHSEAGIIATAAREGIKVAEMSLYVTDFPCPTCAKLIAQGGIKKVFYQKGYAVLDGERVLKDAGVKIIRVKT